MKMKSLELIKTALVWATLVVTTGLAPLAAQPVNAIGQVTPLAGQFNELYVDEPRGLIYVANFTGGRIEVLSMNDRRRLRSFAVSPIPSGTSGMAVSPDGRWMVVTSQPATVGINQLSTIAIINLNDPSNRRLIPFDEEPVAVEFGVDNRALVVTKGGLYLLQPTDGSAVKLYSLEGGGTASSVVLPVGLPQFTRQLSTVNLHASGDRRWIFGVAEEFVFSYQIRQPTGLLTIRPLETLVNRPVFQQVSASHSGDYFMVGQLLMTNDLRVIADTPEAPFSNPDFLGGLGIDSNIDTIYASFIQDPAAQGHPERAILTVMDADNLYVRNRLRVAERIVGRIVPAESGKSLYAISESGLLYIPLDKLPEFPQIDVPLDQRLQLFQFDFCTREPITKTIRLENPTGGAPASFRLSSPTIEQRPGVLFEPEVGVTPAEVKLTVDPGALGPVQGVTDIVVNIETNAINIPVGPVGIAESRDLDQRGTVYPIPGQLLHVVGDPFRDRFYVLDRANFRVLVWDSAQMRQIGTLRVGNTPTWMAMDRGGRFLVVTNSQSENMTVIDLNSLTVRGAVYLPWQINFEGNYPHSIAASNREMVLASDSSSGAWRLSFLSSLPSGATSTPDTLGVFLNSFGGPVAVAAHPDGDDVLIAESGGRTFLWETTGRRLIITRSDFNNLSGAIGAGPDYWLVGDHVVNRSLTPLGDFDGSTSNAAPSGFALLPDGVGVRSTRTISQADTGSLRKLDPRNPTREFNGVRMAQPPAADTPDYPFSNTLAALRDGRLISTASAGIIEFPVGYDTGVHTPRIDAVTNSADFSRSTASGGLLTVFGANLAAQTAGAVDTPLPTTLGGACLTANGAPLPMLFASKDQINAQMLFGSAGPVSLQLHTPGGLSDIFVQQVDPAAPAIFSVSGPDSSRFAAVFRENNTLATLSNPLRPNETAVIFATGLGDVTPLAIAGTAASTTALTQTVTPPTVTIGGVAGEIQFAGLAPGYVGLYQINVLLPSFTPLGVEVPLTITMGANSTTVNVRVVR